MGKLIAASSILILLSASSACKKDEKKVEPTPATETPSTDTKTPDMATVADAAPAAAAVESATVTIAPASESKVTGTVTFTKSGETIKVEAKLAGLTPGDHGFHVHEKGDCSSPDAKSAGGHFNPASVDHGAPGTEVHHSGDLGNITAGEDGTASMSADLPIAHLSLDPKAANNIIGRAVIVHGGADDLKSQPSGNAGPRVGCGVISATEE